MELKTLISKEFNHFHFCENLSNWSPYCRSAENDVWLKQTGPLSSEEKIALSDLGKVLKKYGYSNNICKFTNIFEYMAHKAQKNITSFDYLLKDEAKIFKKALATTDSRFSKIWAAEESKLISKQSLIKQSFKYLDIITDLRLLFGDLNEPKEINAFLLINALENSANGGANIGKGSVTIECSSTTNPEIIMGTLWHELTHILLAGFVKDVYGFIKKNSANNSLKGIDNIYSFANEGVAYSLFVNFGVLQFKHYPTAYQPNFEDVISRLKRGEKLKNIQKFWPDYNQYLNALYIKEKLKNKEKIIPEEMANVLVDNHLEVLASINKYEVIWDKENFNTV